MNSVYMQVKIRDVLLVVEKGEQPLECVSCTESAVRTQASILIFLINEKLTKFDPRN